MTKTIFMRRGQVVELLVEHGLRAKQVRVLIEVGSIKAIKLPGRESGRSLFSRAQIERDVSAKLDC